MNQRERCSAEPCVQVSWSICGAGLLLKRVVPYRGRGAEGLLDVALLEVASSEHLVRPNAGEAVRLQLEPHRELVGPVRIVLLLLMDLAADARDVLDVVAHLVGDHIGLREVTGRSEPCRELSEEVGVDANGAVGRAVVRAHSRVGEPTR